MSQLFSIKQYFYRDSNSGLQYKWLLRFLYQLKLLGAAVRVMFCLFCLSFPSRHRNVQKNLPFSKENIIEQSGIKKSPPRTLQKCTFTLLVSFYNGKYLCLTGRDWAALFPNLDGKIDLQQMTRTRPSLLFTPRSRAHEIGE